MRKREKGRGREIDFVHDLTLNCDPPASKMQCWSRNKPHYKQGREKWQKKRA